MALQLSMAHASACGPRAQNQDAVRLVTPNPGLAASKGYLFALADGVSHCADGALAARSTLQALALDYYATPETWTVPQALDRLLSAQNRWLQANGGGQPLLTTLSALVLRGQRFTLAHVGDCRAYRWYQGALQRISEDHVWEHAQMQHVLKRAMGLDQHLVVDYLEGELRQGERFLLLSDGVWATLNDHQISATLREHSDAQSVVNTLVKAAHLAGSQDNASAVLVHVEQLGQASLAERLLHLHTLPLPPSLKTGQAFEGLTVLAMLSQTRQSVLYRVRDAQGHSWLLKTLPARRHDEPGAQQGLLLEEWFLKRVAGRYFPQVHSLPERQHLYYLMREYQGQTLAERLAESGPLPLADWQGLAARLIRALGMLHRRNILHRDIKPHNLLLGDDQELRVLDFGLAWCPGLSADPPNELPGTPSYLAPEAFAGAAPSPQQDLYAAGVTLYHLLTGHYPYGEIEAFQHPRFGTPASANRYRPDLPDWLEAIIMRSVHSDPQQRFETAEEWLLALDQGERHQPQRRSRPLLEREPLKVWQALALASLAVNILLIFCLLKG
ncbi:bifunctional protein-serine/threonine kinase/phosphatase [Pseudomonas abieticivorans]|uniref:bifunctional protein-serine/threonine kinase/phosphatase n=1 Tax=Pseudomonas abieticivorans TaxID=2931382 RepID=UPI0020C0A99A|nr:bifunctional protein-serine/threonine kinase/phosphatase [Pseudomonas sp. PIA16]